MSQGQWSRVDDYIADRLLRADPALEAILAANAAAGLPAIDVSSAQGKLLYLLVATSGAAAFWRSAPSGGTPRSGWPVPAAARQAGDAGVRAAPRHGGTANLERAGLADKVDIRVGKAVDTLPALLADGLGSFDFIFIDADKPSNPQYLDWAISLSRPGTVVVLDNVVRNGAVVDAKSRDPNVQGVRAAFDMLAGDRRLSATALQTVGSKGYDGFAIAVVN